MKKGPRSKHTLTTKPIRVLQVNANRSGTVMAEAFNSAVGKFDIILFQEPWWGHLASGEEGSINQESWTVLPPVLPIPAGTAPRVLAYFHRRGDFTVSVRLDIAQDLDLQFLEVRQGKFLPLSLSISTTSDQVTMQMCGPLIG
ncbi:MAG TPA: hypothetical protein VHV10_20005 [Ktedonobacteraceae bacterium]|nr:hypothetical protein [Ktedonobacteraceae bacterium]